jgi:nucleotide-binding universal stress UspA family protein
MIQHLLVPLDGSRLAEAAIPAASVLARTLKARVTLLHLLEKDAPPSVHGEPHLTEAREAEAYLEKLRHSALPAELRVDCHVHAPAVADVADGIAEHLRELHPDLIVMCTHGSGGLGRLLRGSLAQQVVAHGKAPLLLVRAEAAGEGEPLSLHNLLVPLDGRPAHEGGLAIAADLAEAVQGRVHLLSVVPSTPALAGRDATLSRFMPGSTQALQEMAAAALQSYLEGRRAQLTKRGIDATVEVGHGKTAELVVQKAEDVGADLIVLATHGKIGTRAFWANSAAVRVQAETQRPLLLVPV